MACRNPTAIACCGLALSYAGWPLVGGTVHAIATGLGGSQAALTPLGRLLGEPDFGPVSSAISGTFEACCSVWPPVWTTRRRN